MMRASLLLLIALADVAHAEPRTLTWKATRGALEPGKIANSFVLTTEAAPGRFSDGEVMAVEPVAIPYRLDVTWRRLGPEGGRSMHVTVADAVVLIKTGKLGLYAFDEAAFAALGWTPLPGFDANAEHQVAVTQTKTEIIVAIDGREVKRFALAVARDSIRPGVGMKGATGYRSAIYVRSLAVRELAAQSQ